MSLNTREQAPRNVIGARDRFSKAEASGVDLVVHYADALRDDDGSNIARERFEAQPLRTASTPSSGSYLETLELVNNAARAMATMEDHSQRIQAKAFELTQRARADRLEANQYISFLEEQLAASEARSLELARQLDEAESRARTSHEWLGRFQQTIGTVFAASKTQALAETLGSRSAQRAS
jgi:hypothetical protein